MGRIFSGCWRGSKTRKVRDRSRRGRLGAFQDAVARLRLRPRAGLTLSSQCRDDMRLAHARKYGAAPRFSLDRRCIVPEIMVVSSGTTDILITSPDDGSHNPSDRWRQRRDRRIGSRIRGDPMERTRIARLPRHPRIGSRELWPRVGFQFPCGLAGSTFPRRRRSLVSGLGWKTSGWKTTSGDGGDQRRPLRG